MENMPTPISDSEDSDDEDERPSSRYARQFDSQPLCAGEVACVLLPSNSMHYIKHRQVCI